MAPLPPIDVLGSFQDPLNLDSGVGKLVNVRVLLRDPKEGKKSKVRFLGHPGLTQICKPSSSPCIALLHSLGNIWSAHADGSIYWGVETATPVLAGTVAVNAQQPIIRLAEDRTALCIASNANILGANLAGTGYIATQAGGVVNCGFDASIQFDPSAVTELDNMTIWGGASNVYANQSAKMYRSQPLQPNVVLANSFATKEARADALIDLGLSARIMWPLGSRNSEQWYDTGAAVDFPFSPFPNSLTEVGIASRLSLAQLRGRLVFVGTDKRVWLAEGQSAIPVSPAWVDVLLQEIGTQVSSLTGYAYGQGGSDFYVLTLPGQWTIELCASTGIWAYRQTPGRLDHAARCATEHDEGVTYVGLDTGEICTLDITNASEPAGVLNRTIITPWLGSQSVRHTLNSIDITSSMGPSAGTFQLDWSVDKGVTWRGVRQITFPQPGVQRAIAREMGTVRRRQVRFQYSGAQAPFTIDEVYADVTPGT